MKNKIVQQINKTIDLARNDLKYVKITEDCLAYVDSLDVNIDDLGSIITELINARGEICALRHQITLENLQDA